MPVGARAAARRSGARAAAGRAGGRLYGALGVGGGDCRGRGGGVVLKEMTGAVALWCYVRVQEPKLVCLSLPCSFGSVKSRIIFRASEFESAATVSVKTFIKRSKVLLQIL